MRMFRTNSINPGTNKSSFILIFLSLIVIIVLSNFGIFGFFAAIFFFFSILALFRFEIGLLLYIPAIVLNHFDILNLGDMTIRGVNLQTFLVIPLLVSFLGNLAAGRMRLEHKKVGKTQIIYLLFYMFVPFLWGFIKNGMLILPSSETLIELKGIVFTFIIFYFCLNARVSEKWIKLFLSTWLFIFAILALRGLYLYFSNNPTNLELNRLVATGSGYNIIRGTDITAGLNFSISLVFLLTKQKYKLIFGCLTILFLYESLISYYRSAILMILVIIILNILITNKFKKRSYFYFLVSIIFLRFISPTSIWERLENTIEYGGTTISEIRIDSTNRLEYHWPKAIDKARDSFPLGAGFMYKTSSFNTYLNWLVRYGLVGLLLGIWITWRIAKDLWELIKKEESVETKDFLYILSVSLFTFWIGIQFRGLTADITYAFWTIPFYFLFAIIINFHYSIGINNNDEHLVA